MASTDLTDNSGQPSIQRARHGYRIINSGAFGLLALVLLLLQQARVPTEGDAVVLWGHRLPGTCIHRYLTGRPCPGCGLTRAMVILLEGHVSHARAVHPSAPWVGLWLGTQLLVRLALAVLSPNPHGLWPVDLIFSLATLAACVHLPTFQALFPG